MPRNMKDTILELLEMHSYRRPDRSDSEAEFIDRFIVPAGVERDSYGNLYKLVGSSSVLWSSHTDSVHGGPGRQNVVYDPKTKLIKLAADSTSSCLGADCAAGVWIMLQMIEAGVPGLYVFHRAEETGCHGSRHIAEHGVTLLDGVKAAIAFDRKGKTSVITKMAGSRTCSDAFGTSVAAQLPGFSLDPTGIWTDTVSYVDIVPECSNISVGYERAHTSGETVSVPHLVKLRDAMVGIDASKFVIERDPTKKPEKDFGTGFFGSGRKRYRQSSLFDDGPPIKTLRQLVYDNPSAVARMLGRAGYTYDTLEDAIANERAAMSRELMSLAG